MKEEGKLRVKRQAEVRTRVVRQRGNQSRRTRQESDQRNEKEVDSQRVDQTGKPTGKRQEDKQRESKARVKINRREPLRDANKA